MNKYLIILATSLVFISTLNAQRTVGLLSYKPWKSQDGLNLIYPHNQSSTFLIDNCGEIVHLWAGDENRRPGNTAYIQESGKLIRASRNADVSTDAIWAGGGGQYVEILNWDGTVEWEYDLNTESERLHHDIAPMPNGNILMIVWELKSKEEAAEAGRDTNTLAQGKMWPDKIIEIDPSTNNVVWEWHVWDHLVQDQYPDKDNFGTVADNINRIDINYDANNGSPDWMHSNALDYDEMNDHIIISVPTFNEMWVIDHSTTTEQAAGTAGGFGGRGGDLLYRWGNPAAYGQGTEADQKLFYQHDVHIVNDFLLPSHPLFGKFAAFNNRVGSDFSSVVIWDNPYDMYIAEFEQSDETYLPEDYKKTVTHPIPQKMHSTGLSSVQVLANNNLLICDGRHGYSFELTPDQEIVWEYVTPIKGGFPATQGDSLEINNNLTFRMHRYPIDFIGFEGKDLTSDGFLELGGDEEFCNQILPIEMAYDNDQLKIYPNPANQFITIEWETKLYEKIQIVDIFGKTLLDQEVSGGRMFLDISHFASGYYFVKTAGDGVKKFIVMRR